MEIFSFLLMKDSKEYPRESRRDKNTASLESNDDLYKRHVLEIADALVTRCLTRAPASSGRRVELATCKLSSART